MRVTGGIFLLLLVSFLSAAENYNLFEENGKVGLKNQVGKVLIPAQYDKLGWSSGQFSVVGNVTGYLLKGQWGLININNHTITKPAYAELVPGDGQFLVANKKIGISTKNMVGCITTSGKEVIPFQYDGLKILSLRAVAISRVANQFKYGLLDLENKKLIPVEYKEIHPIGNLRYAVKDFQNKTAMFTEAGKQLTPFLVDSISNFIKNYAILYQDQQQGLINRDGLVKTEPRYRTIEIQNDGTIRGKEYDEWIFLNGENKIVKSILCDSVEGVGENIFKITRAKHVQLVDGQFKPITSQSISALGDFEKGKAIFSLVGLYGIIYSDGRIAIQPRFDSLIVTKNKLIGNQKRNGKDQWQLLDSLGNKKHTKTYQKIEPFNGKFYPVKNHDRWGAINENGKEIIACVHDSLLENYGNNIAVKFHGQYGIISLNEEWVVIPLPNPIKLISENRYLEYTAQNIYLRSIDRSIIYFTNNKIEVYPGHLLEYLPAGAVWKIDFDGRIINRQAQPQEAAEKVFTETEGLRAIKKDGRYGFIDSRGRLRIANRYEDVQSFSEQLAAIKIRSKWGFINHEEKIIIQPTYEEVFPFKYGVALVKQKGFFGAVNTSGKIILYPRYNNLQPLANHRLLITIDGLKGLSDVDGRLLIGPKFNYLEDLTNGYVIIERNSKYGLLTLQGVSTIPLIYDYLTYDKYNDHYIAAKKSGWEVLMLN